MTQVQVLDASPDRSGGYKVDVGRGQRIGRVSSEWFSRPADERYLSLDSLMASVKGRAERSRTRTVESAAVRVEASRDNAERLDLILPGAEQPISPTHWSFGQLAALVGAPAAYLRQLPAPLVGINLQYGLTNHRAEQVKTLETDDGRIELRAVKRARVIDIDAYIEAGGGVMRDLFQGDDGGWLQDVGLVDLIVAERLRKEAIKVQAEGWRWIDAAPDFPYGHSSCFECERKRHRSLLDLLPCFA